jgi:hypothetical protein
MLIHEIILNYAKDRKNIKKYFNILYVFGIVLAALQILFLILFDIGIISMLLLGIGFYLMFPKRIYDNYEFEKNNPHIQRTYSPSMKGLPGYWCLVTGSIFIFAFLFVLFKDLYNMVNVRVIE